MTLEIRQKGSRVHSHCLGLTSPLTVWTQQSGYLAQHSNDHECVFFSVAILAQANLYGFFACLVRHVRMESSVTALVAETHGIASLVGQHFEGGNQAARVLKREKKISPATSRRLDCLAIAYSIAWHIDVVMCRDFLRDLELQLRAGPQNRDFNLRKSLLCKNT